MFIILLAIVKYIIFAILFALSAGKLKFWIFPNLTEDVGFLESFMPVYDYTYTGNNALYVINQGRMYCVQKGF